jgi:serine/threonine-protein kinase
MKVDPHNPTAEKPVPETWDKATVTPDEESLSNGETTDRMIGRVMGGRFRIIEKVGSGGMGTVYRAVQEPIQRIVALKVLRDELTENRRSVARFQREAKAASLLKSPNTVTLYEFAQDRDGTFYLAMEFLDGSSLYDSLEPGRPMNWRYAVAITRQIAASLGEAHEQGVVHRDLKPDNIFLCTVKGGLEIVKVLDFGLARLTQGEHAPELRLTQTGTIFGTPAYMSPEQAKGYLADFRSDLYSLGVVLYEMAAGCLPFDEDEAVLLMGRHISSPVPPFGVRVPGLRVPPQLERLTLQLLEKKPEHRVASAQEVEQQLRQILDDPSLGPVDLSPYVDPPMASQSGSIPAADVDQQPTVPRLTPLEEGPSQRPRFVWALVAVGLLGVLLGVGFISFRASSSPNETAPAGLASSASVASSPPQERTGVPVGGATTETGEVEIEIRATPAQARMFLDGTALTGNPFKGLYEPSVRKRELVIKAPGYEDQAWNVVFDKTRGFSYALAPATKKAARRRASTSRRTRPRQSPVAAPQLRQSAPVASPRPAKRPTKTDIDVNPPW